MRSGGAPSAEACLLYVMVVGRLSAKNVELSSRARNVDAIAAPNATLWNIVGLAHIVTVATVGIRNAVFKAKSG